MTQETTKAMVEQTENKPYDGTENTIQNNERLFTQKELEEIISERLKRERKSNQALNGVKKLLKTAGQKGLVSGNSYSEMAEDFCRKLGMTHKDVQQDTLCAEENIQGTVPSDEFLPKEEISEKDTQVPLCREEDLEEKDDAKESSKENLNEALEFAGTLKALREKFSGEDIGYLLSSGLFENFAKGRQGNLVDVFSDFCEFMSHIPVKKSNGPDYYEDNQEDMFDDGFDDELSSTAFSSGSSGVTSYEDGLTKQQMDIAKSAGMSYREYASLLESIPKNKTRKSYDY